MKKFFTLFSSVTAALVLFVANAEAQPFHRAQSVALNAIGQQSETTATTSDDATWWGYLPVDATVYGLGVSKADVYHCAIFIPGDHALVGGKSIQSIHFGMPSANVKNIKAWIATSLPSAINKNQVEQVVSVATSDIVNGYATVSLSKAYEVPASGVYVGYSFEVTKVAVQNDAYPVLTGGVDQPNGLFLRTEATTPQWDNLYGYGYGSLYLQVSLDGEFYGNAASANSASDVYAKIGASATTTISVTNGGTAPLANFTYTVEGDGVVSTEQRVSLRKALAFGETAFLQVSVAAEAEQSRKVKTLAITKVNDVANEWAEKNATFTLYTIERELVHNVVVEEYTGTGCGWCPRGLYGMEKLRQTFGERFIGIGIHQYNSGDAMFIDYANYAYIPFRGAPSCTLDRGDFVDPYFGSQGDICDDFRAVLARPSVAAVTVSGVYNDDKTQVVANAEIESLFDDSYSLEFVLVADGLSGTTSAWKQANYYAQGTPAEMGATDELAIFCSGGQYGQSSITGWKFNDVAIASSYSNNVNRVADVTLAKNSKTSAQFTLTLPTKATLKSALDYDQIYVVALLVAADGTIVNAAKAPVRTQPAFPLQFAYSDGTIVADGSVLTLTEVEDDGFGGIQVPTHLYVKNTSDEAVQGGGVYSVKTLANGTFQTCFPVNCVQNRQTGTYETGSASLAAGELKDMLTEWLPAADGSCEVDYQLVIYAQNPITHAWVESERGPKITLRFAYGASSIGQSEASAKSITAVTYYDISGRAIGQPNHGIFLQKTTFEDGTTQTKKVVR
ncbi:MAG: hypothetical protein J6W69_06550 [Bacteroidales bacterium]|nr:hypothetical protein [Bacteroidales bacterium]